MSDLSPFKIADARPLPGFRPWFVGLAEELGVPSSIQNSDQAYADGFADGRNDAEKSFAQERQRLLTLLASADSLQPESTSELTQLIAMAVEKLVRITVGEAQIDRELLITRAHRAAAVIGEAATPSVLYVHPADAPLLHGSDLTVTIATDDRLSPGSLRLETASGSAEDGIETYLAALSEQTGARENAQ